MNKSLLKERRGSDDRGVAITLNRFEVGPVLGDHLCFPPSRANGDQDIKGQTPVQLQAAMAGVAPFVCAFDPE